MYDEKSIRKAALHLSNRALAAFGLLCCERLLPNYIVFQRETGWGAPSSIREALDVVWDWLEGSRTDASELERHKARLEAATPNTEDFDSIYMSPALDAATAASALLDIVLDPRPQTLEEIASFARDTVDMYVQELEGLVASAPDLEDQVRRHPLMQEELRQQAEDLGRLGRAELSRQEIVELRRKRRSPARSNIGLGAAAPSEE